MRKAFLLLISLAGCGGAAAPGVELAPTSGGGMRGGALAESSPVPPQRPEAPARPAVPPVVETTDALLERSLQWVELRGRLVVVERPKGPTGVTLTEIVLDDGLHVILAYGSPPEGWSGLVGQRLSVVGILTVCGRLEVGEAAGGPHLQRWETPRMMAEEGAAAAVADGATAAQRVLEWCRGGGASAAAE